MQQETRDLTFCGAEYWAWACQEATWTLFWKNCHLCLINWCNSCLPYIYFVWESESIFRCMHASPTLTRVRIYSSYGHVRKQILIFVISWPSFETYILLLLRINIFWAKLSCQLESWCHRFVMSFSLCLWNLRHTLPVNRNPGFAVMVPCSTKWL